MANDATLDEALALADLHWSVFPVTPGGKIPHGGTRGCKDATTDKEHVRRLWTMFPGSNIGLATGDGLVVIDLDVKNGQDGLATWEMLCDELGFEPWKTLQAITPSGGRHLYFAIDGHEIRNSAGKLGPGIDVRGQGGYVLAPGSTVDGQPYRWIDPAAPIAPLPEALAALLVPDPPQKRADLPAEQPTERDLSPYVQAAVDAELEHVRSAQEGTRNHSLNQAAFALGQLVAASWAGLERGDAEGLLLDTALACGLGENEARKTIRSGLDAGELEPRPQPASNPSFPTGTRWPDAPPPDLGMADTPDEAGEADSVSPVERAPATPPTETDQGFLLYYEADDLGNAQCVDRRYGGRFVWTESHGWLFYEGTHWTRRMSGPRLGRAILSTLQARRHAAVDGKREDVIKAARPSAHHKNACADILADLCAVDIDAFDQDPGLLNCQNGVIDLATGALLPHSQKQRFTYVLPIEYDPQARSRDWLDFLATTVDGEDMIQYLQLAVGYSLTGYTREECLFYVYGPARSGKGTFTETLLEVLGKEPMATEAAFETFTQRRDADAQNFDLAGLRPCRMVIASESNRYSPLNEAKVKHLTGGNEVRCAFKYKEFFSYRPQFKLWLVSNHPVNADVDDDALWYRVKVLPFPHSHAGEEDAGLKARLKQPHNLRGVLAWAVEGAVQWHRLPRGLIAQTPPAIRQATDQAREELDFVGQWLTECVDQVEGNPDAFVSNAVLFASYSTWCEENGVRPKSLKGLIMSLKAKGYRAGERKWNAPLQTQERGCYYIRLRLQTSSNEGDT